MTSVFYLSNAIDDHVNNQRLFPNHQPCPLSNSSFQSYVSYRLSRVSLTEMIDEIKPLFLYSNRDDGTLDWFNFVNSDQGIDDIKGMFLLTSDIDEMEWVPACVLLESYPTLSSDGSGSSNVRDGEAELSLSSNLLVSCMENEDVLVAESASGIQDCSEEERFDWGYLISATDVGIDQYQCHFLVSKTGDTQLEYYLQLELF